MKTILITGANRGLGLEFVSQLSKAAHVIACCRAPQEAKELQQFAKKHQNIEIVTLDVTDDDSIQSLAQQLKGNSLDWLINNAGISGEPGITIGKIPRDNFLRVFNTNCVGTLKVSEAFLPHLAQGKDKLIVSISSQMGSISANDQGKSYAYRTSKAALNCAMRAFALDVAEQGIHCLLLHPGWVKTNMGGLEAAIDVQTSVSSMLKVIESHKTSHAEALYSYDGSVIGW